MFHHLRRHLSTSTPKKVPKSVAYWLYGTSALTFGIVVIGGLTRLTESGLSIVEWKPVTGIIPPLNQRDWQEEFDKYKRFPEYKMLNQDMTLSEFKFIFSMEWGHRAVGRVIGLAYILPALYFARRGHFSGGPFQLWLRKRVGGLICAQGALGWYMVKSGLEESLAQDHNVPRVSHYRLAAHLGTAFLFYAGALTTAWNVMRHRQGLQPALQISKAFRGMAIGVPHMTFITALSGALVAGLDAGLLYDTFPKMGGYWIPPASDLISTKLPLWRNLFESATMVQLNHRLLAETTFGLVTAVWVMGQRIPLPPHVKLTLHALMAVASLQVGLGISTLLWHVPIPLAASHQAGSLLLLTVALRLGFLLRAPRALRIKL